MDVNISFENPNVDFQIDDLFTLEITAVPGAKGDPGDPATDEQVQTAVDNYLDEHPEIVVEDGSITTAKLADGAVTNAKIAEGTITGNKFVPALPITEVKSTTNGAKYEQSATTKLGVTHTALLVTSDHYQNALGAVNFTTNTSYAVGDYVVYNKKVYRCTTAHSGAWADADFEQTEILPRLDDVEEDVTTINSELTAITDGTTAVGTAEQLLSNKYNEDTEPYHFRKTPFDATREMPVIVGGSLGWNQLVSSDYKSATYTATYDITNYDLTCYSNVNIPIIQGHKYLLSTKINRTISTNDGIAVVLWPYNNYAYCLWANGESNSKKYKIFSATASNPIARIALNNYTGKKGFNTNDTASYDDLELIDLTALFGSTIADYVYSLETATTGAGVAWVNRYIDLSKYHGYDAGSIQSVTGLVSHEMTGFNAWDEEWRNGYYNDNGVFVSSANYFTSKNLIKVLPNTTYYFKSPNVRFEILAFDANGDYISRLTNNIKNAEFTTNADTHYLHFSSYASGTYTTYQNDICINISDPVKNGTYEPYTKHTYALDPNVILRGVPKLDSNNDLYFDGDIYPPDGQGTSRYGIYNLGSLNWVRSASGLFQNVSLEGIIKGSTASSTLANAISDRFTLIDSGSITGPSGSNPSPDKVWAVNQQGYIYINDLSYTDTTAFKTAMDGHYIVCELKNPVAFTAEPYTAMQLCDGYGTEEFVTDSVVPVGHTTKYPINQVSKLDGLPSDFSTLIAPTEKTYKATRNYTTGALLIVDNILYQATANIQNGGTITPNTNVKATTLSEVIASLA